MKTQTILLKLLRVLAFAGAFSIWAPNPAQADTTGMFGLARNGPAGVDVVQNRERVGPYATWTRANEVANCRPAADNSRLMHVRNAGDNLKKLGADSHRVADRRSLCKRVIVPASCKVFPMRGEILVAP